MSPRANLHLHSRYSDGTLWPEQIVARARGVGLELVALTDHDTMEGVPSFLAACEREGLAAVPALEVDCVQPDLDYDGELLAYFPGRSFERTLAFTRKALQRREDRMRGLLVAARERFGERPELTLEALRASKLGAGAERLSGTPVALAKPDLWRHLHGLGLLPEGLPYPDFKRSWFRGPSGGDDKPTAREVLDVVRADGGHVVVPHPGHHFGDSADRMRAEAARLGRMLDWFAAAGAWGVELYWYDGETEALNGLIREACRGRGLRHTVGSDCHGPGSGKDTLELFFGDFDGFL